MEKWNLFSCVITVSNRRRCQLCRYKRCLKAGMNPDAVLTEEERLLRFRFLFFFFWTNCSFSKQQFFNATLIRPKFCLKKWLLQKITMEKALLFLHKDCSQCFYWHEEKLKGKHVNNESLPNLYRWVQGWIKALVGPNHFRLFA